MQILFAIMLFVIGACLGSFLCCQARRLHLKTVKSKTTKHLGARSVCLSCYRQLKWYDNLPIISWLVLGGKCRHCHHRIGCAEILSELCLGIAFCCLSITINVTTHTPMEWLAFVVVLVFTTVVGFLAIYDGLYGELPTIGLFFAIGLAVIYCVTRAVLTSALTPFSWAIIADVLFSVLILGGLYLVLYLVSNGKWVGDGDWLLATAIAIVLAHPWLALNALFVSNLVACAVALPQLKLKTAHQIHLGPYLVIGFVIVYVMAGPLLGLLK